jgi:hypothetical protein
MKEIASLVGNQPAPQALESARIFGGVGRDDDSNPAPVASLATFGKLAVFGPR